MIDSHAHIASDRFDVDRGAVLERAWGAGLTHIVIIGETDTAARDLSRTDSARLSFTAGVHPHDAHTFDADRDLAAIRALIADGACAIGECGLDYHYDHSPRDQQRAAFAAQLELAAEYGLPVVVHSREAEADTATMLREASGRGVRGVLHCFTGTPDLARAALDAGWHVSISGIATFRTWERDDVVAFVPDDLLLVETDSPYLAPVPFRGKRNEPSYLPATIERIALVRGTTATALADITARNTQQFFRLSTTPSHS